MESTAEIINRPFSQRLFRGILHLTGRLLLPLLTQLEISGQENFPKSGPLMVVGNHDAVMEVVLMAIYTPGQVEMLGVGDIPPDPTFARVVDLYGYIPIMRGTFDRSALNQALAVLKNGGVIGMFPEGGIWETGIKEARRGVAWLSYQAAAPVLPIGFGGMKGAVQAILQFKRPKLEMHVGEVMPPVKLLPGKSRRKSLEIAANEIMAHITALIPEEYRQQEAPLINEEFELELTVLDPEGKPVSIPDSKTIQYFRALGLFFYRPVLLDIFDRNLKRPVGPLLQITQHPPAGEVAAATSEILNYINHENPYFLTYRFGNQTGGEMRAALEELESLAKWCAGQHYQLKLTPVRRYQLPGQEEIIIEREPGNPHAM